MIIIIINYKEIYHIIKLIELIQLHKICSTLTYLLFLIIYRPTHKNIQLLIL